MFIRKVLDDIKSELFKLIKLQTTKFILTIIILFGPTRCFACLGSSGAVERRKKKINKLKYSSNKVIGCRRKNLKQQRTTVATLVDELILLLKTKFFT